MLSQEDAATPEMNDEPGNGQHSEPSDEDTDSQKIIVPGDQEADIEEILRQRDEYLAMAKRARADYMNLRRRMHSEQQDASETARSEFAMDMLTILDDLERAIEHARNDQDDSGLAEGVALVRDKFLATLGRYGITPIAALGEPFDHNMHDAVAQQPTDQVEPGTVTGVALTGYMMGEKLLRPARVVVAKAPEDQEDQE